MKQPWYVSHAETITQNVLGQLLAIVILWVYNIPFWTTGWKMQLTFFVVAYARGYLVRRFFESVRINGFNVRRFFKRMKTMAVQLGDKARDIVTGFQGICVARTQWLNGCVRCTLQAEMDKDGKIPDSVTFDEPQLDVIEAGKESRGPADTGGPAPNPVQKSGPTR